MAAIPGSLREAPRAASLMRAPQGMNPRMATSTELPASSRGQALFLAELRLIDEITAFVCRRNRLAAADTDDFASHVKLKLIESDYARLNSFEERSSLRTFLSVTIQRLFIDYRNVSWGKWRPSAAARRLGPTAMLLERFLVRDGYEFEQAYQLLTTNHGLSASRRDLEAVCARLPCRTKRRFENDDVLVDLPAHDSPEQMLEDGRRQQAADRLSAALGTVFRQLGAQDRLILSLRFADGRTVAAIATLMGLDQKPLYRRVERVLKQLREALEAEGLSAAAVSDLLDARLPALDWNEEASGNDAGHPSVSEGADE